MAFVPNTTAWTDFWSGIWAIWEIGKGVFSALVAGLAFFAYILRRIWKTDGKIEKNTDRILLLDRRIDTEIQRIGVQRTEAILRLEQQRAEDLNRINQRQHDVDETLIRIDGKLDKIVMALIGKGRGDE